MFKVMYDRAPEYIKDLFRPKEQITSLVLRNDGNKLAVPFPKTDCLKHSISYSGAILWNNLPRSRRNANFFQISRSSDLLMFSLFYSRSFIF